MFTATKLQAATYFFGVCLFSISFLVFLNSSISFVITDILHLHSGIGDAVGTLGFADELVALVACPVWGLLSDRIGFSTVRLAYMFARAHATHSLLHRYPRLVMPLLASPSSFSCTPAMSTQTSFSPECSLPSEGPRLLPWSPPSCPP